MDKVEAKITEVHDAVKRFVRFGLHDQKFVEKDPFIFFDHFNIVPPTVFGNHPHSGFESVTFMLQGEIFHGDNWGHKAVLGPDGIQSMNSGKGIIHREMPVGIANGLNLWVDLPNEMKYEDVVFTVARKNQVPTLRKDGATVRVLMGESLGMKCRVQTATPTVMIDIHLMPKASHTQPVNINWTTFIYTMIGDIEASGVPIKARHTADVGKGDYIKFENKSKDKPARFFFFSGRPLHQSMYIHQAGHHAYVMATKEEAILKEKEYDQRINGFEED